MTTYSGVKIESLELSIGSPYAPKSSSRRDFVNDPEGVQFNPNSVLGSGFLSGFPNEVVSREWFGSIFSTFFDIYYNAIHIIPENLELGAISSDLVSEVLIWNANLSSDSLLSISGFGQGVSYLGAVLPIAMPPLSTRAISFGVQGSGVALVELGLNFTFSSTFKNFKITGTRARFFDFDHNWGRGDYSVELEYKTEIFVSRSGREQRRSTRNNPRKTIGMKINPNGKNLQKYHQLLDVWHSRSFAIPEIIRAVRLSTDAQSAQNEIIIDGSLPDWIFVGSPLVIVGGEKKQIIRVSAVTGSSLTLVSDLNEDFPIGSKVHPQLLGQLDKSSSIDNITSSVGSASLDFVIVPGSESILVLPPAPISFNGRELFLKKPNWASSVNLKFESDFEEIDFDFGVTARFRPIGFTTRALKLSFVNERYEDMLFMENFFRRMKGRRGEFYMPTGLQDIILDREAPLGSRSISMSGGQFAKDYKDSTVFKAAMIYFTDGTTYMSMIDQIFEETALSEELSTITFFDNFPKDVSPETVDKISWLPAWRLGSDNMTFDFRTDQVSTVSFTAITVEDLE